MKRTNPFIRIYKQCNGLTNMDKYKIIEGGGADCSHLFRYRTYELL